MPAFGGQGFSAPRPRPPILQATSPTATQAFKPGQAQSIQPPSQGTPYGTPSQGSATAKPAPPQPQATSQNAASPPRLDWWNNESPFGGAGVNPRYTAAFDNGGKWNEDTFSDPNKARGAVGPNQQQNIARYWDAVTKYGKDLPEFRKAIQENDPWNPANHFLKRDEWYGGTLTPSGQPHNWGPGHAGNESAWQSWREPAGYRSVPYGVNKQQYEEVMGKDWFLKRDQFIEDGQKGIRDKAAAGLAGLQKTYGKVGMERYIQQARRPNFSV